MTAVRPPVLAGSWYPAASAVLRRQVQEFLAGADPTRLPAGAPVIALAPHAGYRYSGAVAGKVLGLLRERRFAAVFILAPSHRSPLQCPALSSLDAFATPLGEIPIATTIVKQLIASGAFEVNDRAHAFEHAIEILLPFLQCALPEGTPIVPILVGRLERRRRRAAARALDPWRDGRHLLLVSSDLTHYGADYGYLPFTADVPQRLAQLDTGALQKFLARDPDGLLAYAEATGITMCGLEAAAVAIDADLPAGTEAVLLDYARSSDLTGDHDLSVSYAAALITQPEAPAAPAAQESPASPSADDRLSADERTFLVQLARAAVAAAVTDAAPVDPARLASEAGLDLRPALRDKRGVFVTLTLDGRLRGCIGHLEGVEPLLTAVVTNAQAAALRDERFTPVRPEDLPHLAVEVSVLTPLRRVAGPQEIAIGRHGILLSKGRRRAVFLPQVAVEQGWDLDTTLDHLALKAGLPAEAWREGCIFEIFEAEICEAPTADA
jgi:MEMO1 family protein